MALKTALTSRLTYVWGDDPALDKQHDQWEDLWKKFSAGEIKPSELPTKENQKPTIFYLDRLSRKHWLRASKIDDVMEQAEYIVRHCLKKVENLETDAGEEWELQLDGGEVKEESLDQLFDATLFADMAGFTLQGSSLPSRYARH